MLDNLDANSLQREGSLDEHDRLARQRDLLADKRDRLADERDQLAEERARRADRREAVSRERETHVHSICAAADLRDDHADIRDFQADQRDIAANFDAFANRVDDAAAFEAREFAHWDRLRSKANRVAAELDRYLLSDATQNIEQEREAALKVRTEATIDRMEAGEDRQVVDRDRDRDPRRRESSA